MRPTSPGCYQASPSWERRSPGNMWRTPWSVSTRSATTGRRPPALSSAPTSRRARTSENCFSSPIAAAKATMSRPSWLKSPKHAGSWCTSEDLTDETSKRKAGAFPDEVEVSLDILSEGGYREESKALARLLKKRKFDSLLEVAENTALAIQQAKRLENGEEAYLNWQARRDAPFFHGAVLSALRATAAEIPAARREMAARTAVIVLTRLAGGPGLPPAG